jgi:hypothetical protein
MLELTKYPKQCTPNLDLLTLLGQKHFDSFNILMYNSDKDENE